jgi:UDP-N-acetylmuramyl tripeptide synthase
VVGQRDPLQPHRRRGRARDGARRAAALGLGFDECDVGVVLNVTADHLGLGGIHTLEQLADVKGVVPAVARREGHAVLNADDPLVLAMRDRTEADVVLFSTRAPARTRRSRRTSRAAGSRRASRTTRSSCTAGGCASRSPPCATCRS